MLLHYRWCRSRPMARMTLAEGATLADAWGDEAVGATCGFRGRRARSAYLVAGTTRRPPFACAVQTVRRRVTPKENATQINCCLGSGRSWPTKNVLSCRCESAQPFVFGRCISTRSVSTR